MDKLTAPKGQNSPASAPLPADVITSQLDRVLQSPQFIGAPRLTRFLQYVVNESLAGNEDRLKGYAIGLEVFDRPEDFDPQVETIVRVQAVQLRRRLDLYYAQAGRDDPLRIYLPKGSYAPTFEVQFEPNSQQTQPRPENKADFPTGPSVAVLPFQNYGGDPNDKYFADGLTEETIANLARFKDLFVFSRSTTAKLAREGADIRQLHEELGVDFAVEGSVRKSDRAVRVTVQLIDAASDGHILAEQFDRACTPEGVFEIQDEIALLIAGRVADRHGPLGRYAARRKRSGQSKRWETYAWITQYYDYYSSHDPEKHLEVREALPRALERDPNSSDGWAAISVILLDEFRFHLNERPSVAALDHALEHALRAATCDPENAFAYQALAMAYFHRREFTEFRVAANRALELNPGHADVIADIGHCFALLGDWDQGIPLLDRAMELSPVHPGWYHFASACNHAMNGDPENAIVELKQAPMPGFFWYHALMACFAAEFGDAKSAADQVGELLSAHPDFDKRARDEIQVWSIHSGLADMLVAGWRKAGLKIA